MRANERGEPILRKCFRSEEFMQHHGLNLSAPLSFVNSGALHHAISATLLNGGMRTVEETRRLRLRELLREHGSWSALNTALGRNKLDSTFSQIVNESAGSKSRAPKQMGSPLARDMEAKLNKERGWMDTDPDLAAPDASDDVAPPPLTLEAALPRVLDALADAQQRDELRRLLPLLVDSDAPAYRQRLAELLGRAVPAATAPAPTPAPPEPAQPAEPTTASGGANVVPIPAPTEAKTGRMLTAQQKRDRGLIPRVDRRSGKP